MHFRTELKRGWKSRTSSTCAAAIIATGALLSPIGAQAAALNGLSEEPIAMSLQQKVAFYQRTCDRSAAEFTLSNSAGVVSGCACVGTNLAMQYAEQEIAMATRILKVSLAATINAGLSDAGEALPDLELDRVASVVAGCGFQSAR